MTEGIFISPQPSEVGSVSVGNVVRKFIGKTAAPTVNDDIDQGYIVSDVWIDETNDTVYFCLDNSNGTAVWKLSAISATAWTDLTDGGDTTLHDHDGISENTSARHTQGTDTALGTVGTKATPVDADLVLQRNSESANALVTSTWTQIKAFMKTYWDTIYTKVPVLIAPTAIYFGSEGTPVNQEYDITGNTWVTSTNGTPNVAGHLTADCLTAMANPYSAAYFSVREGSGAATDTAPLTVQFNFPGVTTFAQIKARLWYHGSSSHYLYLSLWNVDTSAWDHMCEVGNSSEFEIVSCEVLNPAGYISAGVVKARLRHIQNGISSHHLDVDWLVLSTGPGGGGGAVQTAVQTPSSATGNIAATNVQAAIAELEAEKLSILVGAVLASDHTWTGPTQVITAGEELTIGEVAYLKSDGKYWLADANAPATSVGKIVMATATIAADATGTVLLPSPLSFFRDDSTTEWTVTAAGDEMYLGLTAGELTNTIAAHTTATNIIRVAGYMETATVLNFTMGESYVEYK